MKKPRLLDLFSCQGGAGKGYADAGFEVTGIDKDPQPRYPFEFHRADALEYLSRLIETGEIEEYGGIHASPPCQRYVKATAIHKNKSWYKDHPALIEPTRELLKKAGLPYVIENVPEAPLIQPAILCGTMFGLKVYRHRAFETSFYFLTDECRGHRESTGSHRGFSQGDGMICVAGHNFRVEDAQRAMECPWMSQP